MESRNSSNEGPSYQGASFLDTRSLMPTVVWALMGIQVKSVFGLYPMPFKNAWSLEVHSLYRSSLHSTVGSSILLTTTISLFTP
jgi:hypothetical protein